MERSSVIDLLTTVYKMKPGRISQTVEAVPASEPITEQLRVEDGFPLLMLSRTFFNSETGKPIVYSQDFLRSDYARVHSEVCVDDTNV